MVRPVNCNCAELDSLTIDTYEQFERIKEFFKKCVERGTLVEIKVSKPFYTWSDGIHTTKWYATKWYKCQTCGCRWEVAYPDFPATGFIRKFPTGRYFKRGY